MCPTRAPRLRRAPRLVLLLGFGLLPGTVLKADTVEDFAQTLRRVPDLENKQQTKAHRKLLEQRATALVRPSDLRRALLLPALRDWAAPSQEAAGEEENPLGKTYQKVWAELSERLKESLRRDLRGRDAGRRLAAVTFLAVMADDEDKQDGEGSGGGRPAGSRPRFTWGMVDDLRKLLAAEKDAAVSAVAAGALVTIDPAAKETLDALKSLLTPNREIAERRVAAEGLGRMLVALLERQQSKPVDQLAADVVAATRPGLVDENAAVRRLGLEVIRRAGQNLEKSHGLPRTLTRAVNGRTKDVAGRLDDADLAVRLAAFQTLETLATTRRNLQGRGEDAFHQPLRPAEDPKLLDGVLETLPKLAKALTHEEVRVRLASLYVLETLDEAAAPTAEAVAKALKEDKNGFVRWGAARVLNNMAPRASDKAVPALADALADDNLTVRLAVVAALRRCGTKATAAVGPLGKAVGDSEPRMRVGAIQALKAIGKEAGSQAPVLIRALKEDKTSAVRAAAAEALGQLASLNAGAREALRDALGDSEADVRRAAGDALLDGSSP